MRTILYTILFFTSFSVLAQKSNLQQYFKIAAAAQDLYNQQNYQGSVDLYKQAFEIKKDGRYDLYNAACSAALAMQNDLALEWLRQAFDNGYTNISHVKQDADLKGLHSLKQYQALLKLMQAKVDRIEAGYDKPLQKKLLAIFEQDQKYRLQSDQVGKRHGYESKEMDALWKTIEHVDSINLIKVISILEKEGWTGPEQVGPQANSALFLVIQHADLPTQQKYLPMMRQAVASGKAQSAELALLEDRVALGEKRLQIYGSQIGEDSTGLGYVLPMQDPDNVDVRRADMGLGPIEFYLKNWDVKWDPVEYKKLLPALKRKEGITD
jgi:hypothetical protein